MLVRSTVASKTKWIRGALIGILSTVTCGLTAWSQPPDSDEAKQALVRSFAQGREAFASESWDAAAQSFRRVSEQCPGSPLALESNYYATLADWKQQDANGPDTNCPDSMRRWLREAKSLQERLKQAHRSAPSSWNTWIANMHLLLAQAERQQQQGERAEQRLRALLELPESDRAPEFAWPEEPPSNASVWYELGLLTGEDRRDWPKAIEFFQQAFETSPDASELRCAALASMAKAYLQLEQWDATLASIDQLESLATNESWQTKGALLRSQLANARQDNAAVGESLKPAVDGVLAGRTDVKLAYEVALALLEAQNEEDGEKVLMHLIQREPSHPLAIEARIRVARRAIQRHAWEEAKGHLDQAIELGSSPAWIAHALLARGQVQLKLGLPDSAIDDLSLALEHAASDLELATAIRFELGEALLQKQRWDEAKVHWEYLAQRYQDSEAHLPAWMARVWLHQAELQALRQQWQEAEVIVSRIQSQFPECDCRDDVDYFRARCLISKAQFDEARQLLDRIAREPMQRSAELAARARWMTGETFLMQRRYAEALKAYESVLETGSSPYWQSAAWMQIGQCCELLRDVSAAREAYQTLVDKYAEGPFGIVAQQKLDSLGSSNAPRPSTARTPNDTPVVKQR